MSSNIPLKAFVFVGPSGGGKGTQTKLLIDLLRIKDPLRNIIDIETGKEFRKFIQGNTPTQKLSNQTYMADKLQPEYMAILMWINTLAEKYTGNDHMFFDGSPRRILEAQVLESALHFYGFTRPIVIHLDISNEEAVKRLLKRQRMDDGEESIRKRLAWYEKDVKPTVEYYRNNPSYDFWDIDGERSVEEVHADIVKRAGLV